MISFYCLLAGIVVGVVIGWAHALDHRESDSLVIDLPSAWQHRHVSNEYAAHRPNARRRRP